MSLKFVRLREVLSMTALSRSTIYREISLGNFPKPVPIGRRAVAWVFDEVESWCHARIAGRAA
jgi:prophage regulatory protein